MKKESANMWITDLFVDSPCKPICLCYGWLLICLIISGAAQYMVPSLGEEREYAIMMDPVQIDQDIYFLANQDIKERAGA